MKEEKGICRNNVEKRETMRTKQRGLSRSLAIYEDKRANWRIIFRNVIRSTAGAIRTNVGRVRARGAVGLRLFPNEG